VIMLIISSGPFLLPPVSHHSIDVFSLSTRPTRRESRQRLEEVLFAHCILPAPVISDVVIFEEVHGCDQ
jgi:hypothetical protein